MSPNKLTAGLRPTHPGEILRVQRAYDLKVRGRALAGELDKIEAIEAREPA